MRKTLLLTAALIVVIGGFVAFRRARQGSDSRTADPKAAVTVPLPALDPALRSSVSAYLQGPGKIVSTFREASARLVSLRSTTNANTRLNVCRDIAEQLNREIDPVALLAAASGMPDATLGELAVNDRTARSAALVSCGRGDKAATDDALREVEAIDVVFTRRLKEL